jgi:hypothetical protein
MTEKMERMAPNMTAGQDSWDRPTELGGLWQDTHHRRVGHCILDLTTIIGLPKQVSLNRLDLLDRSSLTGHPVLIVLNYCDEESSGGGNKG